MIIFGQSGRYQIVRNLILKFFRINFTPAEFLYVKVHISEINANCLIYMNLSQEQIKHIAKLARLDLSEEELKIYGEQLSGVLGYIEQLQEVDTSSTEPTAQVTGLVNVLREDGAEDWPESEVKSALLQAPEVEEEQIKVKRVL